MGKRNPKAIGTHGETAVLKVLQLFWPPDENGGGARREILHGHRDIGDIVGCGVTMFEVKAGEAARNASDLQISRWLDETERERVAGSNRFGVLVTVRRGVAERNAHQWWAWVTAATLADMMGAPGHTNASQVRLELGDLLDILSDQGFTTDTPDAAA